MKKKEKKKVIIYLFIVIVILLIILLAISCGLKKYKIVKTEEITDLEKIAINNLLKNTDIRYFIENNGEDKKISKIKYTISKYLDISSEEYINEKIILDMYKEIFLENDDVTIEDIDGVLLSENLIYFNPEQGQYEKIKNEMDVTQIIPATIVQGITKENNGEYKIVLAVVQDVELEGLINYYLNLQQPGSDSALDDLYQYRDWQNEVSGDKKTLDLRKYVNKDNYEDFETSKSDMILKIKAEDSNLKIVDFTYTSSNSNETTAN